MTTFPNEKTTCEHWEQVWDVALSPRLPSRLYAGTRNIQRLLRRHVKPDSSYLEIGCAPGKMLSWVASVLRAQVSGLDYSPRGIEQTKWLFNALHLNADLRCEDLFKTTFEEGQFDVVQSGGVIEHFEDPREVVERHVRLCKPGGLALITVPHYGGIYAKLQRRFDPENLGIHNLRIMNPSALEALAPASLVSSVRAYPMGRLAPGLVSFEKILPAPVAAGLTHGMNLLGLLQPFDFAPVSTLLVLEMKRRA